MSGGFYQYRCKYFYTYNCANWVNINGGVCTVCIAQGRDDDVPVSASLTDDVQVPIEHNGRMTYKLMKRQRGHVNMWNLPGAGVPQTPVSVVRVPDHTGPPVSAALPDTTMFSTARPYHE
ncbi:hypothetical protein N3K66_007410 [Trichothecium roseum]|uniref:Uncharacterized protein n=1 Tax=Trichothecium roseum TaxID=47278 RepID=A0ACC0UVM4_9HYPO|nr:hypothetical protein N3K66_007410 [Trichothecium roseum]